MRTRLPVLIVLLLSAALLGLPAPTPSEAAPPAPASVVPVAPGVQRAEYRLTRASGSPIAAQVLSVTPTDGVRLTSALGNGMVPGIENVQSMNRRLQPSGGVAVINSGFWLSQPVGDPNSYFATGGRLVSESETQGVQSRGAFATTPTGLSLIDRVDVQVHFRTPTGAAPQYVRITGVNRLNRTQPAIYADGPNAVYAYTREFGPQVTIPTSGDRGPATVVTLNDLTMPASGLGETVVIANRERGVAPGQARPIPADGVLLVGYGQGGAALAAAGDTFRPHTQVGFPERSRPDEWSTVAEGVAAGPLIVRDGRMTDRASWEQEGFSDSGHSAPAAPRSAVGVRADGTTLLVAVDGRQPGHSVGMSMTELAQFMLDLGAVDALSLDGGGSTQMSVDGIMRNQPCQNQGSCGPLRPVASGIVVEHAYDYARSRRLSGTGREDTAAAIARASYPQGANEAVLAPASDFPDALAGGPRAAQISAPLLLAGRDSIAPATRSALRDLGVRRVTILGGTAVISPQLSDQLVRDGYEVRRLAGPGRVETAAAIANSMGTAHPRVFVAAAGGFADALSAAAPAGILRAPILLTAQDSLSPATRDVIAATRPGEAIIVGGTGVIDSRVEAQLRVINPLMTVRRLSGSNRYGTARAINEWAEETIPDLDLTGLVVARGDSFPDALAGGPFASAQRRLLMIVPRWDVRAAPSAAAYLDRRGEGPLEHVDLLGGLGVLSSYQQWQVDQLAR